MTICWVPGVGWLGALTGVLGCVFGVPSITHWFHKPGYAPWGISGLILGITGADLSLAYQIKYAEGALDSLVVALSPVAAIAGFAVAAAVCAAGLVLARTKNRSAGVVVAGAALAALVLVGTWGLVTADRQVETADGLVVSVK